MSKMPVPGLTLAAKIVRVCDGDTVEVQVCRSFSVRLLDPEDYTNKKFGCPELSTVKGKEIKQHVTEKFLNQEVVIFIPSNKTEQLFDFQSFDRVLGEVWTKDGINLSEYLLKEGLAFKNQKV